MSEKKLYVGRPEMKNKVNALIVLGYDFSVKSISPDELPDFDGKALYMGDYYCITINEVKENGEQAYPKEES